MVVHWGKEQSMRVAAAKAQLHGDTRIPHSYQDDGQDVTLPGKTRVWRLVDKHRECIKVF